MYVLIVGLIFLLISLTASLGSSVPQSPYLNSAAEQVWYHNELIYENYLGKASLEYNVNFTYDSQFRICSNSKLFVAVSIMQLSELGHFSIMDNIADYLDEEDLTAWGYPSGTTRFCPTIVNQTACQNITFVSLMSMSAGIIPSITCGFSPSQWQYQYCLSPQWSTIYSGSIGSSISSFIQHPLMWAPGPVYGPNLTSFNSYNYANENFIILSYFVQKFSGVSLQDYLTTNIFNRVGMENTFYDPFSQAFQTAPNLATEYFYYTDLSIPNNYVPFATGLCWSVEAKAGTQSGSGGIVSTLPDMVKWYSSLFITKNASLVSQQSLDQILYPWAMETPSPGNPIQYYGLGIEVLFEDPPMSPPAVSPPPISIYYMGGSECMFFTLMLYLSAYNVMDPLQPLQTVPMLSVVARNNRILNVTQDTWSAAQNATQGTWWSLTSYPYGWGQSNSELTDTFFEALNLALYFASFSSVSPVTPSPTPAPISSPTQNSVTLPTGAVVAIGVVPALACILITSAVFVFFGRTLAPSPHKEGDESSVNPVHKDC